MGEKRDPRVSPVRFMLCVNGDQGIPTGHIERVELMSEDGTALDLTAAHWPPSRCPRFSRLEDAVWIGRRKFSIRGYHTWVGNWCWDAITVTPMVGADLLNYLKSREWECEGGDVHLGQMWNSGQKFRPSDVGAACMTAEELAERKAARAYVAPESEGGSR